MNECDYWNLFDNALNDLNKIKFVEKCVEDQVTVNKSFTHECTSCGFIECNSINVCTNCGLIFNENEYINENFHDGMGDSNLTYCGTYKKVSNKYSRVAQMHNWYVWSNNEKMVYKLTNYTKKLCDKLNITYYIDYICNLVNTVLYKIKESDGCKRTKVKDGIIIVCIYYVYTKNNVFVSTKFNPNTLSKLVNLDIKYITRAEKSITELINKDHIKLDKTIFYSVKSPMSYIKNSSVSFNVNKEILESLYIKTEKLINICDKNELLIDHTPLSIGIGCFYYTLIQNDLSVDISHFSKVYNLSSVTVSKIYKKLTNMQFD